MPLFHIIIIIYLFQNLSKYPITHLCSPPTAIKLLVQEKLKEHELKALYYTISAGEALVSEEKPFS